MTRMPCLLMPLLSIVFVLSQAPGVLASALTEAAAPCAPGQVVVEFAPEVVDLPADPGERFLLIEGVTFLVPDLKQMLVEEGIYAIEVFAIAWRRISSTESVSNALVSFRDRYVLHFPEEQDLVQMRDLTSTFPYIRSVGRNPLLRLSSYWPVDEYLDYESDEENYQWNLENTGGVLNGIDCTTDWDIGMADAWDIQDSCKVKIGVLDSGADSDHPDLAANIDTVLARNFSVSMVGTPVDTTAWEDDYGHGTNTSGIIGAVHSADSLGIAGICGLFSDTNRVLVPLKVYNSTVYADTAAVLNTWLADGISYAANQYPTIPILLLNIELDYVPNPPPGYEHHYLTQSEVDLLADAIHNAFHEGLHLTAAAGNTLLAQTDATIYPAGFRHMVVGVSAIGCDGSQEDGFAYGPWVSLCAPGSANASGDLGINQIVTTKRGGGFAIDDSDLFGCTSAAAPHVAGVAGLLLSHTPSLTNEDTRNVLQLTARTVGTNPPNEEYGWGLVRADYALAALDTTQLVHDSTSTVDSYSLWNNSSCVERSFRNITLSGDPNNPIDEWDTLMVAIYEFETEVDLDENANTAHDPLVWPRLRRSKSARLATHLRVGIDGNIDPGWAEVVSSDDETATLRGYAYKVFEDVTPPCDSLRGWYPIDLTERTHPTVFSFSYLADESRTGWSDVSHVDTGAAGVSPNPAEITLLATLFPPIEHTSSRSSARPVA